jgi:hypothetical protein
MEVVALEALAGEARWLNGVKVSPPRASVGARGQHLFPEKVANEAVSARAFRGGRRVPSAGRPPRRNR